MRLRSVVLVRVFRLPNVGQTEHEVSKMEPCHEVTPPATIVSQPGRDHYAAASRSLEPITCRSCV
jgi:hypothetical protein